MFALCYICTYVQYLLVSNHSTTTGGDAMVQDKSKDKSVTRKRGHDEVVSVKKEEDKKSNEKKKVRFTMKCVCQERKEAEYSGPLKFVPARHAQYHRVKETNLTSSEQTAEIKRLKSIIWSQQKEIRRQQNELRTLRYKQIQLQAAAKIFCLLRKFGNLHDQF
eukprot:TRINITY_DN952_c0_g1_i1.p1 TRINITY_DN952_c0_g1~~TRINITY_DN952_c0_g1_i1.p1  ORF type:complete len:163 (-),score=23.00 TRINITY_DN952_c0_g1_i1:188-676(-)